MRFLRTRRFLIAALLLLVAVPTTYVLARDPVSTETALVSQVKRGDFRVNVTTSGELRAPKFVQVTLPQNAMQAQVFNLKIASLVAEGTLVKEGDIVAEVDRSPLATKQTEVSLTLQKAEAQYEQAMLDSTLNLGKAREEQKTMELSLEEKKIAKEQAIYEAPSVKRQAELDYEKAERAMAQAKVDYKTKTEQAQAKMREVGADRDRQRNLLKNIMDVMTGMTIKAPAAGMVIYVKEWSGKKKTAGSAVNPWEPAVATLPDLSIMESLTYVNEIDVRKLRVGQDVKVTLDADPSKALIGKVKQVANVGEQRPNADAKVFEVVVNIEKPDTSLRPGMTTGNEVVDAVAQGRALHPARRARRRGRNPGRLQAGRQPHRQAGSRHGSDERRRSRHREGTRGRPDRAALAASAIGSASRAAAAPESRSDRGSVRARSGCAYRPPSRDSARSD